MEQGRHECTNMGQEIVLELWCNCTLREFQFLT